MEELGDDRAAFTGTFADGGGIVEAAGFEEDGGLFEVGVGGVVGFGGVVFEFEFVEGRGYLGEEVVDGEAFFLVIGHDGLFVVVDGVWLWLFVVVVVVLLF